MLKGEKVMLRELRSSDLPAIRQWRNDPEVTEFLSSRTMSESELEGWYHDTIEAGSIRFFAIETRAEGKLIGYLGLRRLDWSERSGMLDIMIGDKTYWGRRYGEDAIRILLRLAFDDLALKLINLYVLPFNERGIRCYEKCGFRRLGTVREFYLRRGKLWNLLEMEVRAEEFALAEKAREQRVDGKRRA